MKIMNWIWPSIEDIQTANKVARYGLYASGVIVIFLLLRIMVHLFVINDPRSSSIVIGLIIVMFVNSLIGYGIYKMNILAPLFGVFIIILIKYLEWNEGNIKNLGYKLVWIAFYILMYVNSIRGILYYRKYKQLIQPVWPDAAKD